MVYITAGPEAMGMGGGFAFMALPEVFSRLPGGVFFGFAFFLLLFVAALTSAISILESCIAWLTEEFGFARLKATLLLVIPMFILKRRLFAVPGSHGHKVCRGLIYQRRPISPHERCHGKIH